MQQKRFGVVRLYAAVVAAVLMVASTYAGQAPSTTPGAPTAFEVASIKRSKTAPAIRAVRPLPGGRVNAMGMTVKGLIRTAYDGDGIHTSGQIDGGPGWIDSDRFDVQALAGGLSADAAQAGRQIAVMLKALLAERFQLKLRIEQRELPLYDLVVHQAGRMGPTLTKSSCVPAGTAAQGARPCEAALRFMGGPIGADGITMEALAATLGTFPAVERPVRDRTGLTGHYDVRLKFVGVVTPAGRSNPNADTGPNLFTAVQEQLGLRLQPGKGPVSVALVESIAPPSED